VTPQKTVIVTVTAMRTFNITEYLRRLAFTPRLKPRQCYQRSYLSQVESNVYSNRYFTSAGTRKIISG
jgi:hypothetical protein